VQVAVEVAADRLEAYLTLLPSIGIGASADAERIRAELEQAGVVHGIDSEAVLQALDAQAEGRATERAAVARATPLRHGHSGRIEYRVAIAGGRRVTERVDGGVGHKRQDQFSIVRAK